MHFPALMSHGPSKQSISFYVFMGFILDSILFNINFRDGRTMSENSKGVVMNQAANRYNLILLGAHHYLSWNQETLPVKHSFTFWAEGEGACLCNIIVQSTKKSKQEIEFELEQNYQWVHLLKYHEIMWAFIQLSTKTTMENMDVKQPMHWE